MAEAKRDENHIPTLLCTLDSDGETPTLVEANPTTGALMFDDNTTGSYTSDAIAERDENRVPVLMAVSSVDGETPVAVYANSSGEILIDST